MADSLVPITPTGQDPPRREEDLSAWLTARIDLVLRLGLLGILIVMAIYFAIQTLPSGGNFTSIRQSIFLSPGNLQDIGRQMAVAGVIALGETFVIITAGIDLSVGSLVGFAGVIAAQEFSGGWSTASVMTSVLLMSLAIGLVNGFLIDAAKIPPFIVTLGMLGVLRGLCYLLGSGQQQTLASIGDPANFSAWVENSVFGIPNIFLVLVVLGVAAAVFLRFTKRGRYIYAVGSNRESARLSGINVRATILTVYALSAVLAGVAGLLLLGRLTSANPNNGTSYELDAIAAAVLGGASLFGARGTIFGTFVGVVLVNTLSNGIDLMGLDAHLQQVVEGILLVVIVWLDQWRKRRVSAG